MFIEEREDGSYIITGEKNSKGQDIVIKLNSEIKNDVISLSGRDSRNVNISWKLKANDISSLYVELEIEDEDIEEKLSSIVELDSKKCIEELINIVKNNEASLASEEINKAFYESYNKLFAKCLSRRYILISDYIVEGIVKVKDFNKVLGHGSRFIINSKNFTVCEYTGKTITRDIIPKLEIYINGYVLRYNCVNSLSSEREMFKSENDIGYLKYLGMISHIEEGECDIKEYPKLNVPYDFSNERSMLIQCIQRNTLDDIIKYKIAFKGKVEIIDVNKYMVNEFLI